MHPSHNAACIHRMHADHPQAQPQVKHSHSRKLRGEGLQQPRRAEYSRSSISRNRELGSNHHGARVATKEAASVTHVGPWAKWWWSLCLL